MKFLVLLFIAGLALTNAVPLHSHNAISDNGLRDFADEFLYEASDAEAETGLKEELRKQFDELLEKVKEALENGKGIKEETIEKLKEFRDQLRDLKIDVGKRAKELLENLREKMNEYWKKILDKLNPEKVFFTEDDSKDLLGKELRERFDNLLLSLRDGIEGRMFVSTFFKRLEDLREIHEKLRNLDLDISERGKKLVQEIKHKVKSIYEKIMNKRFELFYSEDDSKNLVGKELRELFDDLLLSLRDGLEDGMFVSTFFELLEKLRDIHEKLRNLDLDISERGKKLVQEIKHKVKSTYEKVMNKRFELFYSESFDSEFQIFDILKNLKKLIKEKFNADDLKEKVEKLFGKGSEFTKQLFDMLRDKSEKGKKKILDWIDRVLGDDEQYYSSDAYRKIKDFFKGLNIELKERFVKFGEWIKEKYAKGMEKGKDRYENIKKLAREFLYDTRQISKDVAEDALEFFREYKEELGVVFEEIKAKVKDIIKKEA